MQKVLSCLFLCSSLFGSQENEKIFSVSDLEPICEFCIHQDQNMRRVFHVTANSEALWTVLSSHPGQFDFYDRERQKRWINLHDSLFDDSENKIGQLVWEKDPQTEKWFWERERFYYRPMSYIDLYTGDEKELLATFHPYCEGNEELCVFSDGQTKETLAVAYWFWTPTGWPSCFFSKVQNWQIYIVDHSLLQKRNISYIFLIWILLKHTQDHFPFGKDQCPYVAELPPD